ncbi:MAG TPA: ABC transporter, partial [Bacteroidetes bacterium]|nr:ABC transporter [Bacteroidota bacterium]
MLIFRIFEESFFSAVHELWKNKLRTFLTLLGISIGIFCVITIFSSVDSLENNLQQGFEKYGDDVIYVNKWPWSFEEDYPWWEYMKRPHTSYMEMKQLQGKIPSASAIGIVLYIDGKTIKRLDYSINNAYICGASA